MSQRQAKKFIAGFTVQAAPCDPCSFANVDSTKAAVDAEKLSTILVCDGDSVHFKQTFTQVFTLSVLFKYI